MDDSRRHQPSFQGSQETTSVGHQPPATRVGRRTRRWKFMRDNDTLLSAMFLSRVQEALQRSSSSHGGRAAFSFARFTSRENSARTVQSVIWKISAISFHSNPTARNSNMVRPLPLNNRRAFCASSLQSSLLVHPVPDFGSEIS